MSIPGANLLKIATRAIKPQSFIYYPFISRETLPNGLDAPTYAGGIPVKGPVQPVPRNLYQNMGLDFQKNFYNFFVPQGIIDIARDVSGDQFVWNGRNYQCESKTNWHAIDGWVQVLCVQVPNF